MHSIDSAPMANLIQETAMKSVERLRAAMPESGLFRGKTWLLSPEAFPLSVEYVAWLEELGPLLLKFQRACNTLYFEASEAEHPQHWLVELLDRGKPVSLLKVAKSKMTATETPRVIRPDIMFSQKGGGIAELDSVPGGIGLTAWLGQQYAKLGQSIVGGGNGMIEQFSNSFPSFDVVISEESSDYLPEMEWLIEKLNDQEGGARRVLRDHEIQPYELVGSAVYRFFELFDLPQVESSTEIGMFASHGELSISPPMKPFLEEKMWLALLWFEDLAEWWTQKLGAEGFARLKEIVPQGWVVDPVPLPLQAEWPGLGVSDWNELKKFGNKERELVVKISGFSELGWGSRGVSIGHDLSQKEWSEAIDEALQNFETHPHLLQRFHKGELVEHPYWDEASGQIRIMQGRARLCPYYFISDVGDGQMEQVSLGGVLATIVPADKKILHGMKDAIIVPCRMENSVNS